MAIEEINGFLEKRDLTSFLDKTKYVDKEVSFLINAVNKLNNDVVLNLTAEGEKAPCLLRLPATILNQLIDKFGANPTSWSGEIVNFKFDAFTPKEGSTLSAGVQTKFIDDEPEEITV